LAFEVFSLVEFLGQKAFGITSSGARNSWITAVVLVVFTVAYYWIIKGFRKRNGIDISFAFRSVPPE
jgi:hypothetical protein